MTIGIHQCNFFPSYAFFQKVAQCDKFIVMRHCQFEKNNYQNRFNIDDKWFTMSVNSGLMPISKKKYVNYQQDWDKIKLALPEYKDTLSLFDKCIEQGKGDLEIANIGIIVEIVRILGLKTIVDYDYPTDLKSTARLVDICKHYGATKYLSGPSGKSYLDMKQFEDAGIEVEFQTGQYYTPIIEVIKTQNS